MSKPIHYVISERDFDLTLLPEAVRVVGTPAFRKHVTDYFRAQYANVPGETTVEFADGGIRVTWIPAETDRAPMDGIFDLLRAGDYDRAVPMLEGLLQANPRDFDVLYNLGLVYSDRGRLNEAMALLERATEVGPENANAWGGLGVAALRAKAVERARPALERAIAIAPENPYTLRTLGMLYGMTGDQKRAVASFRAALEQLPDDPVILLSLAQSLLSDSHDTHAEEADRLLTRVLALAPHGEIAELAKKARRGLASRRFRSNAAGALRPDATIYCLEALQRFATMSDAELAPLVMEMATLGEGGLKVNNPEIRYHLKLLPGDFSGLEVVCMLHVGIKRFDPGADSGMDLDDEYAAALSMFAQPSTGSPAR
ncbi:putative Tetratricopeptide TPR_2 repeat protein [Thiocapsa sp. KS1]|nr:tetratricopeptide repeat protein [Thiocapsa sp. KS1]CRI66754.1 putative Tetratricopeptide TPR_2 repeat protein [Thiocapsa sp. KS1]